MSENETRGTHVPQEIICKIFEFCSPFEIFQYECVSQLFRSCVFSVFQRTPIDLSLLPKNSLKKFTEMSSKTIKLIRKKLRSLKVTKMIFRFHDDMFNSLMEIKRKKKFKLSLKKKRNKMYDKVILSFDILLMFFTEKLIVFIWDDQVINKLNYLEDSMSLCKKSRKKQKEKVTSIGYKYIKKILFELSYRAKNLKYFFTFSSKNKVHSDQTYDIIYKKHPKELQLQKYKTKYIFMNSISTQELEKSLVNFISKLNIIDEISFGTYWGGKPSSVNLFTPVSYHGIIKEISKSNKAIRKFKVGHRGVKKNIALRHLNHEWDDCMKVILENSGKKLEVLILLGIYDTTIKVSNSIRDYIIKHNPNLTTLKISCNGIEKIFKSCVNIVSFSGILNDKSLEELCKNCKGLRKLTLQESHEGNEERQLVTSVGIRYLYSFKMKKLIVYSGIFGGSENISFFSILELIPKEIQKKNQNVKELKMFYSNVKNRLVRKKLKIKKKGFELMITFGECGQKSEYEQMYDDW